MLKQNPVKELLKSLVAIPSVSKDEHKIAGFLKDYLCKYGLDARIIGDGNVVCSVGKGDDRDALLFNAHIDTVPPCPGWHTDPFCPVEKTGRIYGLGSNDTKASVAAMADAIIALADDKALNGKVYFAASVQEETLNIGIQQVMNHIGSVGAAVIGEPTGMSICTCMRGLVILKFTAKGRSAHASRPSEGENAIYRAISDIETLQGLRFKRSHPILGKPTIATTVVNGGIKNNMIPALCEFTVDVRSTPFYDNEYMVKLIKNKLKSDMTIISKRLVPKETMRIEKIVQVARQANPRGRLGGFMAMCDWVFVDAPGIIMGPGRTYDSHAPNESVSIDQTEEAALIYRKLAIEYFSDTNMKKRRGRSATE